MKFLLLLSLSLTSCIGTMERMTRPDGSTYAYTNVQVGGAGESHGSSGVGHTFDGQKSFQDLTTVAGLIAAGMVSKANTASKEVTAQVVNTNATKAATAKTAADKAVKLAEIEAATKALEVAP